jgi:hypothetical protein
MKRLKISFSGGATSGYMTWHLLNEFKHLYDEVVVIFANTGQETEETLRFVDNCDKYFGFNTVWVEAVVNPTSRVATQHTAVTYETASRKGEPFEDVIKKYGIPNQSFPHCTRELKLHPIYSYMKSIGWEKGSFDTAIGIRMDETRRVSKFAEVSRIIYPLVDLIPSDKQDVNDWWEEQPFQLGIAEHRGNCKWCWKKSLKKHIRLIQESPEIYDFPRRMEESYPKNGSNPHNLSRVFFRGNRSTNDLFNLAAATEVQPTRNENLDEDSGCSESCEVYLTEG